MTLDLDQNKLLARHPDEIPPQCKGLVHDHVERNLGEPLSAIFQTFATAFPKTVPVIEAKWSPLALVYWRHSTKNRWYHYGVLEGDETNLLPRIKAAHSPPDREDFEQSHRMLPPRWKELFRWFDAIGVETTPNYGRNAILLPTAYSGRMDPEQYIEIAGVYFDKKRVGKRKDAEAFAEHIGAQFQFPTGLLGEVRCWCVSDQCDSLWMCYQDPSGRVYHVRDGQFDDYVILPDPDETLDRYMAQFLTHGHSQDFDFRQAL